MSAEPRRCAFCGTPNDNDAVFCGACGRAIAGPTAAPAPVQKPSPPVDAAAETMLGLPASELGALGALPQQPGTAPPSQGQSATLAPEQSSPNTRPGLPDLGGPTVLDAPAMTAAAMEEVRRSMEGGDPEDEPTAYTGGHTPRGFAPVPRTPPESTLPAVGQVPPVIRAPERILKRVPVDRALMKPIL